MTSSLEALKFNAALKSGEYADWIINTKIHEMLVQGCVPYIVSSEEVGSDNSEALTELQSRFKLNLRLSSSFKPAWCNGTSKQHFYDTQDGSLLLSVSYNTPEEWQVATSDEDPDELGETKITVVTKDERVAKVVSDVFKQTQRVKKASRCWAMVQECDTLTLSALSLGDAKFIETNYLPEVAVKRSSVIEALKSQTPKGRVTILAGPPGTGKTHLIESLLPQDVDPKQKFVYLPTHLACQMDTPQLLAFLLSNKRNKLVFIIEDCDSLVAPRGMDNVNSLSTFLNLTDGILGSAIDLHFIVSTNANRADFDKAVTRPGRLLEIIDVGLLPTTQAKQVYARILEERGVEVTTIPEFKKSISLAEIYAVANGASIFREKQRIGY